MIEPLDAKVLSIRDNWNRDDPNDFLFLVEEGHDMVPLGVQDRSGIVDVELDALTIMSIKVLIVRKYLWEFIMMYGLKKTIWLNPRM